MPDYHVAQINIARMLAPIDDPIMADFVAQLAPVNALAYRSPGFVCGSNRKAATRPASRSRTMNSLSEI